MRTKFAFLFCLLVSIGHAESPDVAGSVRLLNMTPEQSKSFVGDHLALEANSAQRPERLRFSGVKNGKREMLTVYAKGSVVNYVQWQFNDPKYTSTDLIALQKDAIRSLEKDAFKFASVSVSKGKEHIVGRTEFVTEGAITIAVTYRKGGDTDGVTVVLELNVRDADSKAAVEGIPSLSIDIRPGGDLNKAFE